MNLQTLQQDPPSRKRMSRWSAGGVECFTYEGAIWRATLGGTRRKRYPQVQVEGPLGEVRVIPRLAMTYLTTLHLKG